MKGLGRAVGVYVFITNCTNQYRLTDIEHLFKGLCHGSVWGCFQGFDRMALPVLNAVAQLVLTLTTAMRNKSTSLAFPGEVELVPLGTHIGYFITMTTTMKRGCLSKQDLPHSLTSMFRKLAFMVPDKELIVRAWLCAGGYINYTELGKKIVALYRICEVQLSKRKHYDFGLRNILSVLSTMSESRGDRYRDRDMDREGNRLAEYEDILIMKTLRCGNIGHESEREGESISLSVKSGLYSPLYTNTSFDSFAYPSCVSNFLQSLVLMSVIATLLRLSCFLLITILANLLH